MKSFRELFTKNPYAIVTGAFGTVIGGLGYHYYTKLQHKQSISNPVLDAQTSVQKPVTKTLRVAVTGAAGQIGYAFLPLLASGTVFGPSVSLELRLLDIEKAEKTLKAVHMELQDGGYPLLKNVEYGWDPKVIFKDVDVAVFIGGFPRQKGQERKDLLQINGKIFKEQGEALDEVAKKTVKCLVVANPANTNCLILQKHAKSIPKENFTCLTRLDHNRALGQLSERAEVPVTAIKGVTIWGNHSTTQYPDVNHATISGQEVRKVIKDDDYLNSAFISRVQKRGGEILETRGTTSVFSAANAVKDHLRDWYHGTPVGEWTSMGVVSDGSYDIPAGLVFSYPVTTRNFEWQIVQGLKIDEFSRGKLTATQKELEEEKAEALGEAI